jgi:hypothetical protein
MPAAGRARQLGSPGAASVGLQEKRQDARVTVKAAMGDLAVGVKPHQGEVA